MVRYCSVYGCLSTTRFEPKRRFYRFPSDERRCKQWLHAIGRPELAEKSIETLHKHYFACELHFQSTDQLVKKLKTNAVPTLNLPHLENKNPEKTTQTDKELFPTKEEFTQCAFPFSTAITSELAEKSTQTTKDLSSNTKGRKLYGVLRTECIKRERLENELECSFAAQKYDIQNRLECSSAVQRNDIQNQLECSSAVQRNDIQNRLECSSAVQRNDIQNQLECSSAVQRNDIQNQLECSSAVQRNDIQNQLECSPAVKKEVMPPQLKRLIGIQRTRKLKRNCTGNRYETDYKLLAMSLYFASPLAYRKLAKTLSLPSERTLRRMNKKDGNKIPLDVYKLFGIKVKKNKSK